jgi:hypothetical protein
LVCDEQLPRNYSKRSWEFLWVKNLGRVRIKAKQESTRMGRLSFHSVFTNRKVVSQRCTPGFPLSRRLAHTHTKCMPTGKVYAVGRSPCRRQGKPVDAERRAVAQRGVSLGKGGNLFVAPICWLVCIQNNCHKYHSLNQNLLYILGGVMEMAGIFGSGVGVVIYQRHRKRILVLKSLQFHHYRIFFLIIFAY